jgi:hypothetical protein
MEMNSPAISHGSSIAWWTMETFDYWKPHGLVVVDISRCVFKMDHYCPWAGGVAVFVYSSLCRIGNDATSTPPMTLHEQISISNSGSVKEIHDRKRMTPRRTVYLQEIHFTSPTCPICGRSKDGAAELEKHIHWLRMQVAKVFLGVLLREQFPSFISQRLSRDQGP